MDTKINTEHQMEKTGPYYKVECGSNRPGSVKFYRIKGPDDCMDYALHESDVEYHLSRLNAAYAAGQASSLPTLNIGMGEIKESEVLKCCEDYADNYPIEGRITVNRTAMRKALEVFLIAHTKAVTVEAIVTECENQVEGDVEGWTSYDWEVFKKQLTARLIKLIQE